MHQHCKLVRLSQTVKVSKAKEANHYGAPQYSQAPSMDRLRLTGANMGRVFNCRSSCMHDINFHPFKAKLPSLKLKTPYSTTLWSIPLRYRAPPLDYDRLSQNP
jgi:hypothetical protein